MPRSLDLIRIIETHVRQGDVSQSLPAMAQELGFDRETVAKWINKGGLPSVRLGRTHWIRWADLKRWLEAKSAPPPPKRPRPNTAKAKAILRRMGMEV